MDELRIRVGTLEDVEAILKVHRQSILGLGQVSYTKEECQSWASGLEQGQYRDAMTRDGETYLVAENGENLVGFCSYKSNEIIGLYVDPAAGREGIGTRLMRAAEEEIAIDRPMLITLNAALSALAFYQSQGYGVISTRKWKTRGGLEIDVCEMTKEVT